MKSQKAITGKKLLHAKSSKITSGAIVPVADNSRNRRHHAGKNPRKFGVIPVVRPKTRRSRAAADHWHTFVPPHYAPLAWRVGHVLFCDRSRCRCRHWIRQG